MPVLAIDSGPVDVPIIDETIGANLARTVAAHGANEALVSAH
jgi:fatty-acyl-CoA synthase